MPTSSLAAAVAAAALLSPLRTVHLLSPSSLPAHCSPVELATRHRWEEIAGRLVVSTSSMSTRPFYPVTGAASSRDPNHGGQQPRRDDRVAPRCIEAVLPGRRCGGHQDDCCRHHQALLRGRCLEDAQLPDRRPL